MGFEWLRRPELEDLLGTVNCNDLRRYGEGRKSASPSVQCPAIQFNTKLTVLMRILLIRTLYNMSFKLILSV